MTTELSFFEMMAMSLLNLVANSYIFVSVVILVFLVVEPVLGCIALVALCLSSIGVQGIAKMASSAGPARQKALHELTEDTIEYIRGLSVVKSFQQQGRSTQKLRNSCEHAKRINIQLEKEHANLNLVHRLSLYVGTSALICVAALLANKGALSMEMWIAFTLYSFSMFGGVENVNSSALVSKIVDTTIKGLDKIKKQEEIDENGKDISLSSYEISFENVNFSYEEREVIHNISLKVPEKYTLAIVGASGSGKTTLCNLLAGFYPINSGKISIGGENIQDFTCESLLKNITMVFQNVYLFNDTIENNIKFGKPDATREEVIEVAKKARCHDFIMELEHGYDTEIGEGGNTLSGGEKQRISIARAVLKDADIVILDEATASVDPENEFYIQSAINELSKGKTVIIIAHRLKTIEKVDNIIVLDQGEIKQQGNHAQLLAEEGIYKNFVEIRKQAEAWSF